MDEDLFNKLKQEEFIEFQALEKDEIIKIESDRAE